MTEFYVYSLADPRTSQPFYIGKGKGKRATVHFSAARSHENPRKWAKIVNIQNAGLEVLVQRVQENLTEAQALDLEEQLIRQYGRLDLDEGGILTNRRRRGVERREGWQAYKREPRKNKKPSWNKGKPGVQKHSEETRAKIAATRYERYGCKKIVFNCNACGAEMTGYVIKQTCNADCRREWIRMKWEVKASVARCLRTPPKELNP